MEKMKKPDWFELADNDRPATKKSKSTKSALAVIATLALATLASWGFIGSDEPMANANDATGVTLTADAATSPTSTPSASASTPSASSAANSPAATITPPSTSTTDEILPPSGIGEEHEGRERHHEFGERPDHDKKPGHEFGESSKSGEDHDRFGDDD